MSAEKLVALLKEQQLKITTAESCTGGLIAAAITDVAGSSEVFEEGFITYSNRVKATRLSVPSVVLQKYGAVSEQTVIAMAKGALKLAQADIAIAVSGIAGPSGGSEDKPIGTVWVAIATRHNAQANHFIFQGARESVRKQTIEKALLLTLFAAKKSEKINC